MPEPRPASVDALLATAREVAKSAYSPYSNIKVGAALQSADGRVFAACNVENASYGLTICAERAAVTRAIAARAREFTRIAIVTNLEHPLPPCGACRQVLAEFASTLEVVIEGTGGERLEATLAELLPHAVGPSDIQ